MEKIIKFLGSIEADKLLHFIVGMLIAGVIGIIPCFANYALIVAAIAGVAKEAYDQYSYGGWCWYYLLYTVVGGAVMQVFAWIL